MRLFLFQKSNLKLTIFKFVVAKEKLVEFEKVAEEKLKLEKTFQKKFDHLEKDNEKLTKDMLIHMRRANELSETLQSVIFCFNITF